MIQSFQIGSFYLLLHTTFALDVLKQDSKVKDNAPDLWIQSPINIVDELQKEYTRFTFVKEENIR